MRPRRRFGQHFLRDETILAEIVAQIRPASGEEMLEIGPGDGALTARLLREGAALTAVEIDRDLAAKLRAQFPQLRLIVNDILKEDFSLLLQNAPRVAGNLPYNISTPLLIRLALADRAPPEMWLMLQKEVAARLCAPAGAAQYGRLTAEIGLRYDSEIVLSAPPRAFSPPPQVESAFVRLVRRREVFAHSRLFSEIVAAAFRSRRKTLANGLADFCVNWRAAGVESSRRPQTLAPEEFAKLSLHTAPKPAADGGNKSAKNYRTREKW